MSIPRWRNIKALTPAIKSITILFMLLLAACGSSGTSQVQTKSTPSPTPVPAQVKQLLAQVAQKLNTAKTLHGIFNVTIEGTAFSGTFNTEIWNVAPNKYRTAVLQSSAAQFPAGSIIVTDGKQVWQYDPVKKVVYTGPITAAGTATAGSSFGADGQSQFILNLVQTVFTHSDATLVSSSASVNGHSAYDIHVVPQAQSSTTVPAGPTSTAEPGGTDNFNYDGDIYIDKITMLPLQVNLNVGSIGHVTLNLPTLVLNAPIPDSTFTFIPPTGTKILPLQQEPSTSDGTSLTLAQAEQQAGYHLFSISASQTVYQLQGVDALGAPGNQIYTLNYTMGSASFTISEGKPLANLPAGSGQQVSIRGTTATLSTENGSTTLAWTENGMGIRITGNLSKDQVLQIANALS
jgi:outer membrane lipoprotein-sorting protein